MSTTIAVAASLAVAAAAAASCLPVAEWWTAYDPRLRAVLSVIGDHGLTIVILLRPSPIFPYNVLNDALGVSGVRLRDYVLGSFVGKLPGARW
jgi:uncharacterized membrane protein YdjX (TVP38/TMEM64 family)